MATLKLPDVSSKYGAPMGRRNWPNSYSGVDVAALRASAVRLHLARVYIDSGGYDNGGAYWGIGRPLYRAWCDELEIDLYLRAGSREGAKATVRETYAGARFYR